MTQVFIAIFGVSAVFFSQSNKPRIQRWSCICGLCAQPFWLTTTWQHEQWGIFCLCFLYASAYLRGLWNFWLRPRFGGHKINT